MADTPVPVADLTEKPPSFLRNVLWTWLGVIVTLVSGIFLSPYMIRKLGHEGYGIWALVFSIVDYYVVLDFGFKSATVKYVAHHRAKAEAEQVNETLNSSLAYFAVAASILMLLTVVVSVQANRFFQVSPQYHLVFSFMILVVGFTFSAGLVFNLFHACLEAFQRFDISNRNWISSTALRVTSVAVLLAAGYGLREIAIATAASQLFLYALGFVAFSRVFPALRFSVSLVRRSVLRKLLGFGMDTVPSNVAWVLLLQGPSLLIGHFRPAAFVGYYTLPWRLIQIALDLVYRVGTVTTSKTAELCARMDFDGIARLGILTNRYSATLFLPACIFLWSYGRELLTIWVGAAFAAQSAPILPILLTGVLLGDAGQFNSSAILFGLARQRLYSYSLVAEAAFALLIMSYTVPRYGLVGAAATSAVMMALNRGLVTPWLICRVLRFPLGAYLASIYVRPALAALPSAVLAYWMKSMWLPGRTLVQLMAAAAIIATVYGISAFFICLSEEHQHALLARVRLRWTKPAIRF